MKHHNEAGLAVARLLESHPNVEKVWYRAWTPTPTGK